jgi:hypothetical protein
MKKSQAPTVRSGSQMTVSPTPIRSFAPLHIEEGDPMLDDARLTTHRPICMAPPTPHKLPVRVGPIGQETMNVIRQHFQLTEGAVFEPSLTGVPLSVSRANNMGVTPQARKLRHVQSDLKSYNPSSPPNDITPTLRNRASFVITGGINPSTRTSNQSAPLESLFPPSSPFPPLSREVPPSAFSPWNKEGVPTPRFPVFCPELEEVGPLPKTEFVSKHESTVAGSTKLHHLNASSSKLSFEGSAPYGRDTPPSSYLDDDHDVAKLRNKAEPLAKQNPKTSTQNSESQNVASGRQYGFTERIVSSVGSYQLPPAPQFGLPQMVKYANGAKSPSEQHNLGDPFLEYVEEITHTERCVSAFSDTSAEESNGSQIHSEPEDEGCADSRLLKDGYGALESQDLKRAQNKEKKAELYAQKAAEALSEARAIRARIIPHRISLPIKATNKEEVQGALVLYDRVLSSVSAYPMNPHAPAYTPTAQWDGELRPGQTRDHKIPTSGHPKNSEAPKPAKDLDIEPREHKWLSNDMSHYYPHTVGSTQQVITMVSGTDSSQRHSSAATMRYHANLPQPWVPNKYNHIQQLVSDAGHYSSYSSVASSTKLISTQDQSTFQRLPRPEEDGKKTQGQVYHKANCKPGWKPTRRGKRAGKAKFSKFTGEATEIISRYNTSATEIATSTPHGCANNNLIAGQYSASDYAKQLRSDVSHWGQDVPAHVNPVNMKIPTSFRLFIIKTPHEADIRASVIDKIWSSTNPGNRFLSQIWNSLNHKDLMCPKIFLAFLTPGRLDNIPQLKTLSYN